MAMNNPNELVDRPSPAIRAANFARRSGSAMITLPACDPAMLNVLVVAVIMISRSSIPAIWVIGMWVCPGSTRSWGISSDTRISSWRLAKAATACNSALVQTRPPGLWGEHIKGGRRKTPA